MKFSISLRFFRPGVVVVAVFAAGAAVAASPMHGPRNTIPEREASAVADVKLASLAVEPADLAAASREASAGECRVLHRAGPRNTVPYCR